MLVERLKPILEEYNVTAYLAGHDHCAQHIKENSSSVDYHGVGAANVCDPSTKHAKAIPDGSLKFLL